VSSLVARPDGATPDGAERQSLVTSSTAGRLVRVLEALAATPDGLGIRDTSRRTGIDKSVLSRLLSQLEALSMATKDEMQGRYHVGPRLFALSSAIVARDSLSRAARPILENLVRRFNETCYLATRHLDTFTFSAKVECTRPIRYIIELGSTAHLHAGAAGRAILLGMPQDEARAILHTAELEQLTDRTVTDVERLLQLAAEDQTRGWSFSHGERMEGAPPWLPHSSTPRATAAARWCSPGRRCATQTTSQSWAMPWSRRPPSCPSGSDGARRGRGRHGRARYDLAAASIRPLVIYQFGMPPAQVALRCCGWPPTGRRWGAPLHAALSELGPRCRRRVNADPLSVVEG
jgi:DNA-binding IclR family transcriptional regulator